MENSNHLDQWQDYTDWFDDVLKELTRLGYTRPLMGEEYELIFDIWDHFYMSPAEAAQLFSKMFPAELTRPLPSSLMDSLQEPSLQSKRVELRKRLTDFTTESPEYAALRAEINQVTGLIAAARKADNLVLQQFIPKSSCPDSDSQEG